MEYQTTIDKPFTLSGPGLHTGKFTHATMLPAPADSGIVIRRTDITPNIDIAALAEYVVDTNHGTTIGHDGVTVSTIEHLMSSLRGMSVDNALIEVDGPEIPILDGSARMWIDQIAASGIVTLDTERRYYSIQSPVVWRDAERNIELVAEPADTFSVESTIEFQSDLIGNQTATLDSLDQYQSDIARCRTFVFLHEVEILLAHNLIKGGDLENALVFVDKPLGDEEKQRLASVFNKDKDSIHVHNGVLNTIEPYFANEPARHKLLDIIGDISLVGMPLKARFKLRCPGHYANTQLAKIIRNQVVNQAIKQ